MPAASGFFRTSLPALLNAVLDRTSFAIALLMLVTVPTSAWTLYDRMFNYVSGTAEVAGVERVCYAGSRPGDAIGTALPQATCDALRAATNDGRKDIYVRENVRLTLRYTSPLDGRQHESQLEKDANGRPFKIEDNVQIMISRIDPHLIKD